jgi:hypothetical protein
MADNESAEGMRGSRNSHIASPLSCNPCPHAAPIRAKIPLDQCAPRSIVHPCP